MRFSPIRILTLVAIPLIPACKNSPPPATMATAPVAVSPPLAQQPAAMSAATTSPVLDPPVLKFSNQSIRAMVAGTKNATIRKGVRAFPAGVIKAISAGNADESVILQKAVATPKKLSELTEGDARANGSDSLDELKNDLSSDYPGIQPEDVVTVITFRVSPADASK